MLQSGDLVAKWEMGWQSGRCFGRVGDVVAKRDRCGSKVEAVVTKLEMWWQSGS